MTAENAIWQGENLGKGVTVHPISIDRDDVLSVQSQLGLTPEHKLLKKLLEYQGIISKAQFLQSISSNLSHPPSVQSNPLNKINGLLSDLQSGSHNKLRFLTVQKRGVLLAQGLKAGALYQVEDSSFSPPESLISDDESLRAYRRVKTTVTLGGRRNETLIPALEPLQEDFLDSTLSNPNHELTLEEAVTLMYPENANEIWREINETNYTNARGQNRLTWKNRELRTTVQTRVRSIFSKMQSRANSVGVICKHEPLVEQDAYSIVDFRVI